MRFQDWQELLPISSAVLTSRLRHLCEAGVLVPQEYDDRPRRFEYHLSPRGAALWPVLATIGAWELAWATDHGERVTPLRHRDCGRHFEPVPACRTCAEPVTQREITAAFGPSGSWPRSAPNTTMRRRSSGSTSLGAGFFPQSRALIGNRWSAAMLGAAYLGAHRFSEFQRRLGAPATVVADRLRTFRDLGVLTASGSADRSNRSTYRLTDKGRAFLPVVMSAIDWGQRWFLAPEGPAVVLGHRGTGHEYALLLLCSECRAPLSGRSIEAAASV
ncbi:HxlR family transcriptional regulator [Actinokineospora sp. NBRC 105648]|nr:HxlR family transcriptional regulator [Actinokineospora sp. NBRC 105648]